MTRLGYARVSTSHQTLDQQHDALNAAGVERIFDDTMSGTREDRPGLTALLSYARQGDTVTVVALDRLGRSLSGIIKTLDELRERGILVRSLREGIDYSTPMGKMLAGIFAALAEYERTLINERAAAAREARVGRGKRPGRKPRLTADQVALARRMRASGETISTLVSTLGASRATVYRALGVSDEAASEDVPA